MRAIAAGCRTAREASAARPASSAHRLLPLPSQLPLLLARPLRPRLQLGGAGRTAAETAGGAVSRMGAIALYVASSRSSQFGGGHLGKMGSIFGEIIFGAVGEVAAGLRWPSSFCSSPLVKGARHRLR